MLETVERGRSMRRDVSYQRPSRARMTRSQETLFSIAGFLDSVSVSACYCIPQCVRLIAGDWCLHVVD